MKEVIVKIQNLQNERDLYKTRFEAAEAERRNLEKSLSQMDGKCEALKMEISGLESNLALEKMRYMTLEDVSNNLEDELAEKETEIAEYRRILPSLQAELNKLQREREEYVIGAAQVRSLKMELEEQNRLLKNEIEDYKMKSKSLEYRNKTWRPKPGTKYIKLKGCVNIENTQINVVDESNSNVVYKEGEPVRDIYFHEPESGKKREDIEEPMKTNGTQHSFYDIIQHEDPKKLVERLHQLIDGQRGKAVGSVLLKCLQDKLIRCKPSQKDVASEFAIKGSWSGIHKYMNENDPTAIYHASQIKIF